MDTVQYTNNSVNETFTIAAAAAAAAAATTTTTA